MLPGKNPLINVDVDIDIDVVIGGKGKGGGQAKQPPKSGSAGGARAFDPKGNFNFRFEMSGIAAGAFRAVEGLSVQTEMIEYQGGGDKYARQIPGRPKIAPVVLKKGYVNTATLWDWMKATMDGKFQAANCSVVLLDEDGTTELARYNLGTCWPSSWKGWQLDGMGNEAMVEELELQVRTIDRVQ
jgi:phage tail-like protein